MSLAVIIFLFFYFIVSFYRLDWALMLVLAGLPLYVVRFYVFGIPSTLLEVMILFLFLIWVLQNYKQLLKNCKLRILKSKVKSQKSNVDRYPFDIELILVLIISFIAMGVSSFSDSAMGIWKAYFFEPIIIYLLIFNIFFKRKKEENVNNSLGQMVLKIILPLSISAFAVSLFAIYQKITGQFIPNEFWAESATRRVTSIFSYPNAVGLFLGPIFVIMLAYLLFLRDKYKKQGCRAQCEKWSPFNFSWFGIMTKKDKIIFIFLKFSSLVSLLAVYFARSEGALIAMALGVFLMAFFSQSFKSLGSVRVVMIILIVFASMAILMLAPLRELAVERISLNDFSGQIRKAQWQETGIMLRDGNYLFGAGLAGYQEKIEPYHTGGVYIKNNDPDFDHLIKVSPEYQREHWQPLEIFLYPHNIFLNFWVELGLAGMIIFIWIILKVFYLSLYLLLGDKLKIENRFLLLGAMSAMFVLVIHGIVDVPYFKNDLAIIFWLIVAMVGIIQLKISHEENDNEEI